MSITVTFYSFSKRRNSTALPTSGTSSAEVSVLLKDVCSQEEPILELASTDPDNYNSYNFVYIPFFSRYYFVKRKEVDNGSRLIVYCEEDYLGSFKSAILLSTAMIKYSYQGLTTVPDPRMTRSINYTVNSASADFEGVGGNNYYICVTGESKTTTYSITRANLYALFDESQWVTHSMEGGDDESATITNFGNMLGQLVDDFTTQGTTFNFLRSAYILPFPANEEVLGSETAVIAGHLNTGVYAYPLVVPVYSQAVAVSIPWSVNDWRRCSPYTEVYMYLPFFGVIPIETNTVTQSSYLTVKFSICYSDGGLSFSVETDTNRIIATGSTNVRSELGLGSSNVGNLGSFAASNLSNYNKALASFEKAGSLGEGIFSDFGQSLASTAGALDSLGGGFSMSGGLGGLSTTGLELSVFCWTITKTLTDSQANFATLYGYPLFQVGSLSGHTGFLQTDSFVFDYSAATLNEKDTVSNLLNSGIYIE